MDRMNARRKRYYPVEHGKKTKAFAIPEFPMILMLLALLSLISAIVVAAG